MAQFRTAKGICERALRKIGAYSINDTSADPEELDEALHQLDLQVSYLAGTEYLTWLQPQSVKIDLTGGEASFDLLARLGNSAPGKDFQFLTHVELDDGKGNRSEVRFITRREFDGLNCSATTGAPEIGHLDRTNKPIMRLFPYPATGFNDYDLILTFQTFAVDLQPSERGDNRGGKIDTGLRKAWELWAVEITAAACSEGPVRRLPVSEVDRMYARAEGYKERLVTWENTEKTTEPPISDSWEIV